MKTLSPPGEPGALAVLLILVGSFGTLAGCDQRGDVLPAGDSGADATEADANEDVTTVDAPVTVPMRL